MSTLGPAKGALNAPRGRVQAIVVRDGRILMVRHRPQGQDYWCLPGGAQLPDETAEQAVLRELREECRVNGVIVRQTSHVLDPEAGETISYLVDIGDQTPSLGHDPELTQGEPVAILMDVKWKRLSDIPERDRAYVWAAGLLGVEAFAAEVEGWGDEASYPGQGAGGPSRLDDASRDEEL